MSYETVHAPIGGRPYDIHIGEGLLEKAGDFITPLLARPKVAIVTDENVYAALGARLEEGLKKSSIEYDFIILSPGEQTKSFAQLESLTGRLLDLGVERGDLILAFGGGVIGDLAGFAAAILRRGCRFAQLPTTLLAQVDSSVGGKTAVNAPQGKNLIGAFHQPSIVLADIGALDTLPERELRAGYAEVIKYGAIADAPFFDWLEANAGDLLSSAGAVAKRVAVKKSCETKAKVVAEDEREHGARALLNLGHTFGHALEAALGYSDALLHGEGVAIGMVMAYDYAAHIGMCPDNDAARLRTHVAAAGLPTNVPLLNAGDALTPERLLELMMQDKKVESGKLTLILPHRIGAAEVVKDVDVAAVGAFLKNLT
ncbi:MAG: 3-dehydroquinate synthase [Pseudomonadota bacterium]